MTARAPSPAPTAADLQADIERHLVYDLGKDAGHASLWDWRMALSFAVRDRIVDPWIGATRKTYAQKGKRVYYLSMEFLIGRLLEDAIQNLGLGEAAQTAMHRLGADLDQVMADEPDAALGNGGLGRLAACFLESLSTIGVPAHGYGIRYEHGLFRQSFDGGRQVEEPEDWLRQPHAWEFQRPEAAYGIGFGGEVARQGGRTGGGARSGAALCHRQSGAIHGGPTEPCHAVQTEHAPQPRCAEGGLEQRVPELRRAAPAAPCLRRLRPLQWPRGRGAGRRDRARRRGVSPGAARPQRRPEPR